MNVLWITNNVLPELAEAYKLETSVSGSWLIDWAEKIASTKDINLAVATVYGKEYKKIKLNNITYYLLPGNGKNMLFYTRRFERIWNEIAEDFKVDIVHLHGTEYSHGLAFLRSNPKIKAIVSVQGIISRIAEVYFDGLPKKFGLKYFTMNELIKFNSIYAKAMLYKYNSRYEKEIFRRVKYANTVNLWDESWSKTFNPEIKCFHLEYNLREKFYSSPKWDVGNITRYQIFTNPGGEPIKGIHIICKAIAQIKVRYPKVSLIIPGKDVTKKQDSGYDKYLNHLIKKLDIKDNIFFVGRLTEKEMARYIRDSHIVVVPSAIEGTSLVLREAMYIGTPCIASFRGGMSDFIQNKVSGFLYDFNEYACLAQQIMKIFENDEVATSVSFNAIKQAEQAHARERNIENCIAMYKKVYSEEE